VQLISLPKTNSPPWVCYVDSLNHESPICLAEAVVIIDAATSGATPGTVHRFDASTQPLPNDDFRCSTHAFGMAEAIELAPALARLPRSLIVYGIEGKNFAAGVGLSPEVEEAVSEVARQLLTDFSL
jgi:hydrogenase maturation protease